MTASRSTDFSELLVLAKEMKDIFKKSTLRQENHKKKIARAHNEFFKKLQRQERINHDPIRMGLGPDF